VRIRGDIVGLLFSVEQSLCGDVDWGWGCWGLCFLSSVWEYVIFAGVFGVLCFGCGWGKVRYVVTFVVDTDWVCGLWCV
jgi:hypothetical protein